MKKLSTEYDSINKVEYDLFSTTLFEFRELAKSWYDGVVLKDFDTRNEYANRYEPELLEIKK